MVGRTIPNNDEISNALCSLYAEGVLWLSGPSPNPSWPLPLPLPRREGEWLPRYPYGLDVGFVLSLISIENSSNVLWYLYAGGVLWVRNAGGKVLLNLWVLWEKENSFVREKTPQRVTCVSFHSESVFYFSQIYTEEQNTQRPTETLSQPITQSVTANVSWKASVTSVCRRRSVGSTLCANEVCYICEFCERKKYPLWERKISSVREKDTLCEKKEYPPCEKELPSMRERTS